MALSQSNRPFAVTTPLGPDALVLRAMSGAEALSEPFALELDLASERRDVAAKDLLGQRVTVELRLAAGSRYWNGLVTRFSQADVVGGRYFGYRATLRPWLWFLSYRRGCRIFQRQTVPEIVKAVLRESGFSDIEDRLNGSYPAREYCVQYRESDLAFVSRLMEQEGIYYFFAHDAAKHTLVLADGYGSHRKAKGYAQVPYFPRDPGARRERDYLDALALSQEVRPGRFALRDYDFERPTADLETRLAQPRGYPLGDLEVFDYPGLYTQKPEGEGLLRVWAEELQALEERVEGGGNAAGLEPGGLFELTGHPRQAWNREYLVVSVEHTLGPQEYEAGAGGGGEPYRCRLVAADSRRPFRAPRATPRPTVRGPQTAVVVGKAGEEIWTDRHARVKVQFRWDRQGQQDESSSCWVRVAQLWAGKGWGGLHIPRIGEEVIVEFLEGDPDRPIVTGRLYNGDQAPPYELPGQATRSGVRTRSSKQGDASTFNELRFEDRKGEERVYLHAERDFERVVENDDTLKVGFDKQDRGDQRVEVFNNQRVTVGAQGCSDGSQTVEIHKDRTVTLATGSDALTVRQGQHSVQVEAGGSVIEAATSIELKVGGSSIKVEPGKITLSAPQVSVQASAQVEIQGEAVVTVKGGIVQIN